MAAFTSRMSSTSNLAKKERLSETVKDSTSPGRTNQVLGIILDLFLICVFAVSCYLIALVTATGLIPMMLVGVNKGFGAEALGNDPTLFTIWQCVAYAVTAFSVLGAVVLLRYLWRGLGRVSQWNKRLAKGRKN